MAITINLRAVSAVLLLGLSCYGTPGFARHGEAPTATSSIGLANRIPEPAPYVVSETTANANLGLPAGDFPPPPYENLWTSINDVGGCSGCHTGLYDQWNGAMMSNAWRDPGWRGAFLLVARLTSTDGCKDVKDAVTAFGGRAPDGTQAYDCSTDPATGKLRSINPFANANDTSTFNVMPGTTTPFPGVAAANYSGSGSLMDDFCSRCHMPTNYVDATVNVSLDAPSGMEHGHISPTYDPTSVNPAATITTRDPFTGQLVRESFATRMDGNRAVNSNSGQIGIVCEVCHTNVETRYTPYHNYNKSTSGGMEEYWAAVKNVPRWDAAQRDQFGQPLPANHQDMLVPPDVNSANLGYALGAGAFRLSPHALHLPERFGPLTWNDFTGTIDTYVSQVFAGARFTTVGLPTTDGKLITVTGANTATSTPLFYSKANAPGKHDTFYQAKFERAEMCAACHDVTNPATIKNAAGKWVGGFPIERTYTEYLNSRYADRPGNVYFDANFKRDCQTCHMQQSFGQPGTGLTLYTNTINPVTGGPVTPLSPLAEPSCDRVLHHPGYSHHFVGGNAYITKMIGADTNGGTVEPYPELLETSFTSVDKNSRYNSARFDTTPSRSGPAQTQHERFAWDRLRNVLVIGLTTPASVAKPVTEALAPLTITVRNEGSGHNYPTGFPEGRNSWVAVRAVDTRNTAITTDDVELMIQDSAFTNRRSAGVGNLTDAPMVDPNFPGCNWIIPEGSPDPHARQFRAVATLDALCPTLDLPYATPVNLTVNTAGLPTSANGAVIDRNNPTGLPRYTDVDNDGDFFDDSFLIDTRLGPPRKGVVGTVKDVALANNLGARYSVVVPSTVVGPISVTTAVYYQSFEAIVAKKFLGNLANTDDLDANEGLPGGAPTLEPCVLKSACDRVNQPLGSAKDNELRAALRFDPVVVEGAPPVPAEVLTKVIQVSGTLDNVAPQLIINNSKATGQTNMVAAIPANRHWSPSPYGGATGNYAVEGSGEQNVNPGRIVKITFSEPVRECGLVGAVYTCQALSSNTFYLTDSKGRSIPALLDQIDDTTWALFPFTTADKTFLAASINILHVAPSRAGWTIRDYSPVIAADGRAGNILMTGPTITPVADAGQYTFGFKIM